MVFERNQEILDDAEKSRLLLEEIARELAVLKQQYFEEVSRQQEESPARRYSNTETSEKQPSEDAIIDLFNVKKKQPEISKPEILENPVSSENPKNEVYQSLSGEPNDFASVSEESSSYLSDTEQAGSFVSSESEFNLEPEQKVTVERSIDDVLYTKKTTESFTEGENIQKINDEQNSQMNGEISSGNQNSKPIHTRQDSAGSIQRASSQSSILSWLKIDKKPVQNENNNDFDWITSAEPNHLPPLPKEQNTHQQNTQNQQNTNNSDQSKSTKYRIKSGESISSQKSSVRNSPLPGAASSEIILEDSENESQDSLINLVQKQSTMRASTTSVKFKIPEKELEPRVNESDSGSLLSSSDYESDSDFAPLPPRTGL
jgi:hypothetical protein